jgi:hypothetical protein
MNAYWRAANYVSVGQIHLYENPLLKEPLKLSHVKPLVVGHWGTVPGQNLIYVHLNRVMKKYDLNMFCIAGLSPTARRWWETSTSEAPTPLGRAWRLSVVSGRPTDDSSLHEMSVSHSQADQ